MRRLALAAALVLAAPLGAQPNLLTNPGFESGLTGWTPGSVFFFSPWTVASTCPVALSGGSGACATASAIAAGPGLSFITSAPLASALVAGQQYRGSLLVSPFDAASGVTVRLGYGSPSTWFNATSCGVSTGCLLTYDFVADATGAGGFQIGLLRTVSDVQGPATTVYVDNASLTAVTTTTSPEPATLAPLGTGLLALGWLARRRRLPG